MINKTYLLATAAMLAVTVGLAGPAAADGPKIGLAVANLQADFFNQIKQAVEASGKEKGIEIITVDAKGDSATQVSQIQDLITSEIDALIYIPAGATAAGVPVKAAKEAGIPVIAVDRNAPDAPGDTFIATNSVASAKILGDHLCKLTGGNANVVIIQGQLGTTPQVDRSNGWDQAVQACPGLKVTAQQASTQWMQDEGFAIAQDMLQRDPTITAIFGQADALALGAAQAVKVANLDHKVYVVGFDGDVAGLEAVRDGVLDATMTQQTQLMGRMALDAALQILDGKGLPAEQLQEATLTVKENVDPFIANHP